MYVCTLWLVVRQWWRAGYLSKLLAKGHICGISNIIHKFCLWRVPSEYLVCFQLISGKFQFHLWHLHHKVSLKKQYYFRIDFILLQIQTIIISNARVPIPISQFCDWFSILIYLTWFLFTRCSLKVQNIWATKKYTYNMKFIFDAIWLYWIDQPNVTKNQNTNDWSHQPQ